MKTVADPVVVQSLKERLGMLRPDSARRWGTMTPQEMLCHLGDAAAMVLLTRPRPAPIPRRRRVIVKSIALWSPLPWPRGFPTSPMLNPKADGTQPSQFERDLARAIAGIDGLATAKADAIEPVHGVFGTMSLLDWQRWAYRHTDHHLRQFGL